MRHRARRWPQIVVLPRASVTGRSSDVCERADVTLWALGHGSSRPWSAFQRSRGRRRGARRRHTLLHRRRAGRAHLVERRRDRRATVERAAAAQAARLGRRDRHRVGVAFSANTQSASAPGRPAAAQTRPAARCRAAAIAAAFVVGGGGKRRRRLLLGRGRRAPARPAADAARRIVAGCRRRGPGSTAPPPLVPYAAAAHQLVRRMPASAIAALLASMGLRPRRTLHRARAAAARQHDQRRDGRLRDRRASSKAVLAVRFRSAPAALSLTPLRTSSTSGAMAPARAIATLKPRCPGLKGSAPSSFLT